MKKLIITFLTLASISLVNNAYGQQINVDQANEMKAKGKKKGKDKADEMKAKGKDKADEMKAKGKDKADEMKNEGKDKADEMKNEG